MGRVVHGASCPWGELSLGRDVLGRVLKGRVVLGRVVREPSYVLPSCCLNAIFLLNVLTTMLLAMAAGNISSQNATTETGHIILNHMFESEFCLDQSFFL
jgi:hypothetical protein